MGNMKFKQVSDKLTQARIDESAILVQDIRTVYILAMESTDVNKCLWNLKVLGQQIDELKENVAGMIRYIQS